MRIALHHQSPPITSGKVLHWPLFYDVLARVLFFGKENQFRHRVLDLVRLNQGDSVLDIGCGTGTLALAAREHVGSGGRVCGIDASPQMIKRATKKALRAETTAEFRVAPVEALPFPDATFDVVLSTLMLHHLPSDIQDRCFRETLRVLKKGGLLFAVDFGGSPNQSKGLISRLGRHQGFDVDQLVPLLKEVGFDRIEPGKMGYFNLHYLRALSSKD
jgi:ubiquinone/menaquinone biosynthesis C-methylase UbiE